MADQACAELKAPVQAAKVGMGLNGLFPVQDDVDVGLDRDGPELVL